MNTAQVDRRSFLKGLAIGGASLLLPKIGFSEEGEPIEEFLKGKPNILMIMTDDTGTHTIEPYGQKLFQTPRLSKLAKTGMKFQNCHATPICWPARAQLMTGKYNFRNQPRLPLKEMTLAHVLKKAGYSTCISGKWHMGQLDPQARGFDESVIGVNNFRFWNPHVVVNNSGGYLKELNKPGNKPFGGEKKIPLATKANPHGATELTGKYCADVYTDFLCDFITRNKDQPFFAYYPMKLAHGPYTPTPDTKDLDKIPDKIKLAHTIGGPSGSGMGVPKYKRDMMEYIDKMVGKLVDHLESLKIRENTIIIFTADDGGSGGELKDGFVDEPGGKGCTLEGGTHVPLIVNWKGTIASGKTCNDLVDFSDILPTVAELGKATIPAKEPIDGRSFAPQLMGKKGNPREWVYFHWIGGQHLFNPKNEALRREDFKDIPEGKDMLWRWVRGKRYKLYADGRLYDLQEDINEKKPIKPGTGAEDVEKTRIKLQEVLDQYDDRSQWLSGKDFKQFTYIGHDK